MDALLESVVLREQGKFHGRRFRPGTIGITVLLMAKLHLDSDGHNFQHV